MKTMTIPAGPEALTAEWLTDALRSTGVLKSARVTSFEPEIIGEGSGFIGQLARVKLHYDTPELGAPASLIAKFPAASPAGREIGNLFDFYRREIRFYEDIAAEVELTTPARHYSASNLDTGEHILLLEDLAPARVGDHLEGCTIAEAELAVRSIAEFHATWWESPRLEEIADWMPVVDAPVHQSAEASYQQAWAPFVENFGAGMSPEIRKTAEAIASNVIKLQSSIADRPHTIVHGDYRMDNLFFGTPEGGADFTVADWQIACRGRGIFDVAYLLCGGLDPEPRAANEERLVRLYHDTLVKNGVKGYSFEQCWTEYRRMALYVLVYVVISLGTLDFANERGLALMKVWLKRSAAAIEHLKSAELMPA
ncbi:MAG: ecdysteroid 22-kinase family protein [Chloroflexota bacterium]|nr:ecdysteroid 22-kinase family protein [Chloroflexota bacterium]